MAGGLSRQSKPNPYPFSATGTNLTMTHMHWLPVLADCNIRLSVCVGTSVVVSLCVPSAYGLMSWLCIFSPGGLAYFTPLILRRIVWQIPGRGREGHCPKPVCVPLWRDMDSACLKLVLKESMLGLDDTNGATHQVRFKTILKPFKPMPLLTYC